eukprot:Rhum_TRINITY_DN9817_c1_g1::Rhum_TRINITY_DN9817_c1_g1_i1::g.35387::m.35387
MPQPPAPRPLDNRVLAACRDILHVAGAHADNGRLWLGGGGGGDGGGAQRGGAPPPAAPAGPSEVVARAVARGRRDGAAEQNAIAEALAVLAEHTLAQYASQDGLGARGLRTVGTPPHPPRSGGGGAAVGDFVADAEDADSDSDSD